MKVLPGEAGSGGCMCIESPGSNAHLAHLPLRGTDNNLAMTLSARC
jgi:hypothetical protein